MTREGAVRTAPAPSSASRTSGGRRGSGRVDVRAWAGGIRFSAFTAIMLGLVVLAVFTLVPTVGTYLGQRQQIAALAHSVQVSEADVATLQQQKDRWNDPAYVTSQARERPGEVVYLVDNDLPATAMPPTQAAVSAQVQETRTDWMAQLMRSVAGAGLAQTAAVPPAAPAG